MSAQPQKRSWKQSARYKILAVIAVLAAVYVVTAFFLTRHALDGTKVGGLRVGGKTHGEVVKQIEDDSARAAFLILPKDGVLSASVRQSDMGVSIDAEAAAHKVAGFTLNPVAIVQRISRANSGFNVEPVHRIDDEQLKQGSEWVASQMSVPKVNAKVFFTGMRAWTVPSEDGVEVKASDVQRAVRESDMDSHEFVEVPATRVPADVQLSEASEVKDQINDQLDDRGVVLEAGKGTQLRISADLIRAYGYFDDDLELQFRSEAFRNAVMKANPGVGDQVTDARIEFRNGKPHVLPDKPGVTVDSQELTRAVHKALQSDSKKAKVSVGFRSANFTAEDAADVHVPDVLAESEIRGTANKKRTENVELVVSQIDSKVIEPGESFSFNNTVGPRRDILGYNTVTNVKNGGFDESPLEGPASQVATALFNSALEAGLGISEQHGERQYRSTSPIGRDAFVGYGKDLVLENTTQHPVVIESFVTGNTVHVRLRGTESFDVSVITTDQQLHNMEDGCRQIKVQGGEPVITYRMIKDHSTGKEIGRDSFVRVYFRAYGETCS